MCGLLDDDFVLVEDGSLNLIHSGNGQVESMELTRRIYGRSCELFDHVEVAVGRDSAVAPEGSLCFRLSFGGDLQILSCCVSLVAALGLECRAIK